MAADMMALKDYVTAQDHLQFARLPEGVVSINVTHSNLKASMIELRFDLHTTVGDVKQKIYTHVGTNPGSQELILKSGGEALCRLSDDTKMLGFYGVQSGMEIHVIDNDPFSLSRMGGLEDVSKIQKYRMSEEDYDKRDGTLRSWIKEQKAKDPEWTEPWNKTDESQTAPSSSAEVPGPETVQGMSLGQRCQVEPGGRRGRVEFIGEVEGMAAGYWVGVKFDEPVGRGDGTVKGKIMFKAEPKYGGFIRPGKVSVGDFPEKDIMADLEDSDDDEI